jgi:hypothetical protein
VKESLTKRLKKLRTDYANAKPLGSSKVTLIAQDEPPVDSTANAIFCGVACQFAIFQVTRSRTPHRGR